MKQFMNEDFLLSTPTAQKLYHEFAETMPILDYHCHINPQEIAEDRKFDNITQVWLGGDHYKWRFMRSSGIDEYYIVCLIDALFLFILASASLYQRASSCDYALSALSGGNLQLSNSLNRIVHLRFHVTETLGKILRALHNGVGCLNHVLLILQLAHLSPH